MIGVGLASIAVALLGLGYNSVTLRADFSQLQGQLDAPYFYPAFYIMSAICILCYLLLIFIGVQLIRGKTNMVRLLCLLIVVEILYVFTIGTLWLMLEYGMSIGAATGVANGGMTVQAISLFPIWAPIVAFFASRSLQKSTAVSQASHLPPDSISHP